MEQVCGVCGATNGAAARFCSNCGSPLARSGSAQQRKVVSVVFSDLVGSTSMAEGLDPESLAAILGDYFGAMRTVLERHGGVVEKYIGDAIVAVFGVPVLHEDDAQRAVRAALDMRAALAVLDDELATRHGIRLEARTGVNTGEVAVGTPGTGESLALGHAVNMAARLEQAAGPGEILVGDDTHRLLPPSFRAEAVGPLVVKGSSEPVAAWRITGVADGPAPGWDAHDTFVGRDAELQTLDAELARVLDAGDGRLVTVLAPPGQGKSRLAAEWSGRASRRALVLVGRCLPYGEAITYAPLVDIVRHLESERGPAALDTILVRLLDGASVARSVRSTVQGASHGSPQESAWAFRRLFEALATEGPLVVVFEDLHWAEPVLLDLVRDIATTSTGSPILLVCLARPELLDARPGWAERPGGTILRLDPLSETETDTLLLRLDDANRLDAEARARIVEAAAGIPLFVEQMVALRAEGEAFGEMPPTIRALLASRIDRLGAYERSLLDRAAIVGEAFDRSTLMELMPDRDRHDVDAPLASAVRAELVRPEPTPGSDGRFRFSHALIRDAVYEAMPRRTRSDLHEAYAGVLERMPGAAQEVVGHHLEAAYRQRLALGPADADTAALAIRAGRALHAAGSRATSREESRLATALLRRAVELVQVDRSALAAVLPDLVEALVALPDLDAADRVHGDAVELARALGDRTNELRAEMAWARTGYLRDAEGWDAWCERIADEAIEHFGPLGDDANLAQAWLLAAAAYLGTEIAPGVERLRRAEVHARRVDDERARIRIWDELGGAMLQGRTPYPEVLDFTRQEIAWARERGITFTEADGMLGEAYGIVASGDLAAARTALDQVRVLFASLPGVVAQHGESYTLGGTLELDDGDPVAAEALFRRAMELFHEAGNRRWARSAAAGLAHALLDQSRPDEAASVLEALAAQPATASVRSDARVLDARARLAAARGDRITALDLARQAVDVLADSDSIQAAAGTHEVLADILASMDDVAGARRALRSASALYAEKAYEPGSARIARLLRKIDARPHVS